MSRINRRTLIGASAGIAAATTLGTAHKASAQDAVTLKYWLWDSLQQPAYEAVAAKFTEYNPNITIAFEQYGWDDYWTGLQTGMISGSAPDVFTDHLQKYPEFAEKGQLVDIAPLIERDGLDINIYQGRINEPWERDGKRYGLPKDWDTISLVYNKDMLDEAGIDPAVFDEWDWNSDDGGKFQEIIATLTIDENGNNGLSADFDSGKVERYGLAMGLGDASGQSNWSIFTQSTGWDYLDAPWTPPYHFDDERFITTIQYLADQKLQTHFITPEEMTSGLNIETVFAAGSSAMVFLGSWLIGWVNSNVDFSFGFGRLPAGSAGRKSMINGLADSIWSGTQYPDEAWEWVKFLASEEAQMIVAEYAVVFPAIPAAAERALEVHAENGLDVSSYLDQANEENGTFLQPIADYSSEYTAIIVPAMQSIALGQASAADVVPDMNEEINDLFE